MLDYACCSGLDKPEWGQIPPPFGCPRGSRGGLEAIKSFSLSLVIFQEDGPFRANHRSSPTHPSLRLKVNNSRRKGESKVSSSISYNFRGDMHFTCREPFQKEKILRSSSHRQLSDPIIPVAPTAPLAPLYPFTNR